MSVSKKIKVAVIIPTLAHKNDDYLKLCVESLRATTDWDIFVVSNGSPHKPMYQNKIFGITTHLHTRDQGQCVAVNIGLQAVSSDTDYVLVSNDDMYYAPGWNKNLKFDRLVFSPNLVEPTTGPGSAPPFRTFDGGFTLEEFKRDEVNAYIQNVLATAFSCESEDDFEEEDGFNLPFFVRKDVMDTVGGYDTKYDPWGSNSDTDLQAKFHLAGVETKRERDVLVYHFSNKSGTFDGTHQAEWQQNWDYFTQKWGFNRDMLGSDVWYSKDLIDEKLLKYKPSWKGKYVQKEAD